MKKINILSFHNGVGLQKDQEILVSLLRGAGHEVDENNVHQNSLFYAMRGKPHYDINIFCERLNPLWFKAAKTNWLIPNQDMFLPENIKLLKEISLVACKTRYGESVFKRLGCKTTYIGFTSIDRWQPEVLKNRNQFFHLAGKSPFKGTGAVIEAWRDNPDFPELILLENPMKERRDIRMDNVHYISEYVSDSQVRDYMNRSGCHLCPSIAEGFGHYIVEALACKALVLTTDAPPMNELVSDQWGVLCPYQVESMSGVGRCFHVKAEDLAEKVRQILSFTDGQIEHLAEEARKFYIANDSLFKSRLLNLV